jgi:hypothetical protein
LEPPRGGARFAAAGEDEPTEMLEEAPAAVENPDEPATAVDANAPPQFKLLRLFDHTVEPGKSYRYRVKLRIVDQRDAAQPAAPAPAAARANAAPTSRPQTLAAPDWVESPTVTVPKPLTVYAGPVKAGADPKATIWVTQVDPTTGLELAAQQEFDRGDTLNIDADPADVVAIDWIQKSVVKLSGNQKFSFVTNAVLIDARGGKIIGIKDKHTTEPGEVQILDPTGNVQVRRESQDAAVVEIFAPPTEAAGVEPGRPQPKAGPAPRRANPDEDDESALDAPVARPRRGPDRRPIGRPERPN